MVLGYTTLFWVDWCCWWRRVFCYLVCHRICCWCWFNGSSVCFQFFVVNKVFLLFKSFMLLSNLHSCKINLQITHFPFHISFFFLLTSFNLHSGFKYKKKNTFFSMSNIKKKKIILSYLVLLFLKYYSFNWCVSFNDCFLSLILSSNKE